MTALLAATGVALLTAALLAPASLLWAPGAVLLALAWNRHENRHARKARKRAAARRGYL